MGYPFPPGLERLVHDRMSVGDYQNEDELLLDAMLALEEIESRGAELRDELRRRIAKANTECRGPLDRDAVKAAGRQRLERSS